VANVFELPSVPRIFDFLTAASIRNILSRNSVRQGPEGLHRIGSKTNPIPTS